MYHVQATSRLPDPSEDGDQQKERRQAPDYTSLNIQLPLMQNEPFVGTNGGFGKLFESNNGQLKQYTHNHMDRTSVAAAWQVDGAITKGAKFMKRLEYMRNIKLTP